MHRKQPKIKKDDKVIITTGKEKGKIGKVLNVDREKERVLVEKVNMVKRHAKPSAQTAQGGIIEKESPINISNVMIICNKCAEPTRIAVKLMEGGSKVRICKKCGEVWGES